MTDVASKSALSKRIGDALPQTQCTRCGFPDCAAYAHAIAYEDTPINQCPPGGAQGIARLAAITGKPVNALNPEFGTEAARTVVFIDEDWCIGCTLCIKACPTDAIMGSNKRMHIVIEPYCTGCELCLPVCPVDCIKIEVASGQQTGWDAWSATQAQTAHARYTQSTNRQAQLEQAHQAANEAKSALKLAHLAEHSNIQDPALLDRKRLIIEAAIQKAKEKKLKESLGN